MPRPCLTPPLVFRPSNDNINMNRISCDVSETKRLWYGHGRCEINPLSKSRETWCNSKNNETISKNQRLILEITNSNVWGLSIFDRSKQNSSQHLHHLPSSTQYKTPANDDFTRFSFLTYNNDEVCCCIVGPRGCRSLWGLRAGQTFKRFPELPLLLQRFLKLQFKPWVLAKSPRFNPKPHQS